MDNSKEKRVEIESDGKQITLVVKMPTTGIASRSDRVRAKAWTECVQDGIMTKKELAKFMRRQGIWDDKKELEQLEISQKLLKLEQSLFIKKGRSSKVKADEGKKIAIEMRILRLRMRELVAEKIALENNTAESLADNSKFDFLVSACTYYENDQRVYNSLEEYTNCTNTEIAFAAATALANMLYNLDQGFESRLPENKFLKMFGFCDDKLSLVDTEGQRVDPQGRKINDFGQLLNEDDKVVDTDGNLLDDDGNYIPTVTYVDGKGKKITPNG
jgi:hypothetical protein